MQPCKRCSVTEKGKRGPSSLEGRRMRLHTGTTDGVVQNTFNSLHADPVTSAVEQTSPSNCTQSCGKGITTNVLNQSGHCHTTDALRQPQRTSHGCVSLQNTPSIACRPPVQTPSHFLRLFQTPNMKMLGPAERQNGTGHALQQAFSPATTTCLQLVPASKEHCK